MSKLEKRIVYRADIKLESALSVSGGIGEETDSDVMRDYDGEPFVPGTSLAGAFRDYLELAADQPGLMGFAEPQGGKMSRLLVTDILFNQENLSVVTRDGVGLDENKNAVTGAKFDLEAIDTGATGTFFMELAVRETFEEENDELLIKQILQGIQNGDICIGQKKTRGYGRMSIETVSREVFDKKNFTKYGQFYGSEYRNPETKMSSWDEWNKVDPAFVRKFVHIKVPLKLDGCISIRKFQAKKDEPDYVHIQANKKPIIPGTSFAGAIRSRVKRIMLEATGFPKENIEAEVNELFGYVKLKTKQSKKSKIVFGESEIVGGQALTITRTAISRFESSAKTQALYKEVTCAGGTVTLDIWVAKDVSNKAIPILLPALLDLQRGYLAVGGMTSIGRGILKEAGEITIDTNERYLEEDESVDAKCRSLTVKQYAMIGGETNEAG